LQERGKAFQVADKGTCTLLGTAEGSGVALNLYPAAAYRVATVVLFDTGVLARKFFPAGKLSQKKISLDKHRGK